MSAPKWDRLILARNGALENKQGVNWSKIPICGANVG